MVDIVEAALYKYLVLLLKIRNENKIIPLSLFAITGSVSDCTINNKALTRFGFAPFALLYIRFDLIIITCRENSNVCQRYVTNFAKEAFFSISFFLK